jgi:hypothetical protein
MSPMPQTRIGTVPAAPEGTGQGGKRRDGTDGADEGEGRRVPRAILRGRAGQGARSSSPRQHAAGRAQLSLGPERQRRGLGESWGK